MPNNLGFRVVYRFLMADGRDGGKLSGTLRFRILQSTLEDQFEFDVNGQGIAPADIRAEPTDDDELPYVWYEVDLAKCPPLAGNNELGMTMTKLATRRPDQDPLSPYEPFPYMEEMIVTVEVQLRHCRFRAGSTGPDGAWA